jgi:hypothetical protein
MPEPTPAGSKSVPIGRTAEAVTVTGRQFPVDPEPLRWRHVGLG